MDVLSSDSISHRRVTLLSHIYLTIGQTADQHGQHHQWKTHDVQQRDRNKRFGGIQLAARHGKHKERRHGNQNGRKSEHEPIHTLNKDVLARLC